MDNIWDGNPSKSEVVGRCGGDENPEWSCRTDKSRTEEPPNKPLCDVMYTITLNGCLHYTMLW